MRTCLLWRVLDQDKEDIFVGFLPRMYIRSRVSSKKHGRAWYTEVNAGLPGYSGQYVMKIYFSDLEHGIFRSCRIGW